MYSEEQIKEFKKVIIETLPLGKSLLSILREFDLCSNVTVYSWLNKNSPVYDEKFFNDYVCAREDQADYYADEIIDIADTEQDVNRAKVRIDARKWKAGKMKPKLYGDKLMTEGETKNINIELTREERDKEIERLKKKLND